MLQLFHPMTYLNYLYDFIHQSSNQNLSLTVAPLGYFIHITFYQSHSYVCPLVTVASHLGQLGASYGQQMTKRINLRQTGQAPGLEKKNITNWKAYINWQYFHFNY
ncbi:hypothetical protein ILYODFUR_000913 [Ilyodon furcidens]|uniref:Uncharacterized protein n=1 Tax=Ilyodon furcidens TaxID=33524 RepID=A0ABV0T5L2_9TELE